MGISAKRCNKCDEMKPLVAFSKQKKNPDGLHYTCKECVNIYRGTKLNIRVSQQGWNLKGRYGIALQDYNQMFDLQKGCCAICNRHQSEFQNSLAVDHDHKTGKVRGLLCIRCNRMLGNIQDSRSILIKAFQYLGRKK